LIFAKRKDIDSVGRSPPLLIEMREILTFDMITVMASPQGAPEEEDAGSLYRVTVTK
jgi:hypothetical protein